VFPISRYAALRLARRFASADGVHKHPAALEAARALEAAAQAFGTAPVADETSDAAGDAAFWLAKVEGELLPALEAVGLGSRALANDRALVHFRNGTLPNALLGRYLEVRRRPVATGSS
jgi:hypothetical protein